MTAVAQAKGPLGFDPKALKQKYAEERAKRMRPEGTAQYRPVSDAYPEMLEDPFDRTPFSRAPVSEDVDVLVVGAGMSGIMTAGALRKAGVNNLRIIDGAADFGGTWYWNRYPGAACDTEAYIYMPWLEETGYVPSEKYARGHELLEYFKRLGRHLGLDERAYFKTKARRMAWDDSGARWIVTTDRGDAIRARFICLCSGNLAQPKLPGVAGIDEFKGKMFLTSRWDYEYTGGSPDKPELTKLKDKRVAIIGTGCTSVQAVPILAQWCKRLLVFQRTPSMINHRGNRATDEQWVSTLGPGWQDERMRNFEVCVMTPVDAKVDLVNDGWTSLARNLADVGSFDALDPSDQTQLAELYQLADFKTMEEARARVSELVRDEAAAENLKPYFNVHCKRPTFHDEFLPAFNNYNVELVDTTGKGVERITGKGVVAGGKTHEVDCIIFATGFEALTMCYRTGEFEVLGVGGKSLEDKWSKRFRTLHGVFTHNFPNMAVIGQVRDGAGSFNATFPFSLQASHVGEVFGKCLKNGTDRIEVTRESEDNWARVMREKLPPLGDFLAECTPGYLNNEGDADQPALRTALYGGGTIEYGQILDDWRIGGIARDTMQSKIAS